MRYAAARALVVLVGVVALGGCGLLESGNSDQVCADTRQAYEKYMAQVRAVPANDPAQWKKVTTAFAARMEKLSKTAEEPGLRTALEAEAKALRAAAVQLGTGDVTKFNAVVAKAPDRIGRACA